MRSSRERTEITVTVCQNSFWDYLHHIRMSCLPFKCVINRARLSISRYIKSWNNTPRRIAALFAINISTWAHPFWFFNILTNIIRTLTHRQAHACYYNGENLRELCLCPTLNVPAYWSKTIAFERANPVLTRSCWVAVPWLKNKR